MFSYHSTMYNMRASSNTNWSLFFSLFTWWCNLHMKSCHIYGDSLDILTALIIKMLWQKWTNLLLLWLPVISCQSLLSAQSIIQLQSTTCLCVYLPVDLSVCLHTCLSTFLCVYLVVRQPVCLSTYLSISLPVYLPTRWGLGLSALQFLFMTLPPGGRPAAEESFDMEECPGWMEAWRPSVPQAWLVPPNVQP